MELARISSKGQVTIPKEIREKLNLKKGSKLAFIEEGGRVFIENEALLTYVRAQKEISEASKGFTQEDLQGEIKQTLRNS